MTRTWMRHGTFAVALLFAAGPAFAQSSQPDPARNQRHSATATNGNAREFVKNMIQANQAEIRLGQLAADHAQSSDVKEYAEMIVKDHTTANEKLQPLAQQLGVDQSTSLDAKHQALETRLAKLNGAEFDREFMKAMVADHQQAISRTKNEAGAAGHSGHVSSGTSGTTGATGTSGSSASTAAAAPGDMSATPTSATEYATMTLPILQKHLQDAQQIQQRIEK